MTKTQTHSEAPEIHEEQIEAARPGITWLTPSRIATVARSLARHGWHIGGQEPYPAVAPGHQQPLLVLAWPKGERLNDPAATIDHVWASGIVVAVVPRKQAMMDPIARLRASNEPEEEDAQTNHRLDPRLRAGGSIPGWLLD
jgi:hypothetical protein